MLKKSMITSMKISLIIITLALVLLLNSCGSGSEVQNTPNAPPPTTETYINTDSTLYTPTVTAQTADFNLTATYVNRQQNPIYVGICGDDLPFHSLQKYTSDGWRDVREAVGYGCASELQLNELAPQEELTKSFYVSFDMPYELPGFYRLQWTSVFSEADINAVPISPEQRVSNYFEIK